MGTPSCAFGGWHRLRRLRQAYGAPREKPIHLSRGQRPPATTNHGSLTTYNSESKAYGRGGGVGRGRGVGTGLGVMLGVPVGVADAVGLAPVGVGVGVGV
jgi:hypothetical protein